MAKTERIYVDLSTVGAAPSKKAVKSGPGMGKSKSLKGTKIKPNKAKTYKNPTPAPKPGKPGKKGKK
jgi:hypothetical protein